MATVGAGGSIPLGVRDFTCGLLDASPWRCKFETLEILKPWGELYLGFVQKKMAMWGKVKYL